MREEAAHRGAGTRIASLYRNAILLLLVLLTSCRTESQDAAYARVWSLYTSGALSQAADAALAEADKRKQSTDRTSFWRFRLLQAEALLAQGKVPEASALIHDAIPADAQASQLEVRRLMDQADAASKSRHPAEAIAILNRIKSQAADPDLRNRIDVLSGSILSRNDRIEEAEEVLNHALVDAEKRRDHYQRASALLNLASCEKWRYRYSDAIEYALRAGVIADHERFKRLAGGAHANLGSLYRILGDFERASEHEGKAVDMLSDVGDRGNELIALGELGLLHESQDHFEKAINAYERAFELAEHLNWNDDAARNADNLSEAYIELHRWDKGEEWNEKSRHLAGPESSSGPYQLVNAARIADGRGQTETAIQRFKKVIAMSGVPAELIWDCHSYLARIYVRQHHYAEADREYREVLDVIDKARSDLLKSQFQITFLSRLIHFHQEYVDLLIDRKDDVGALRIIESSRARVLADRMGLSAVLPHTTSGTQLTQLARDTNTSIISFWLAPKRSFGWLIDKNGVQRFDLPPDGEIELLVTAYRDLASSFPTVRCTG